MCRWQQPQRRQEERTSCSQTRSKLCSIPWSICLIPLIYEDSSLSQSLILWEIRSSKPTWYLPNVFWEAIHFFTYLYPSQNKRTVLLLPHSLFLFLIQVDASEKPCIFVSAESIISETAAFILEGWLDCNLPAFCDAPCSHFEIAPW